MPVPPLQWLNITSLTSGSAIPQPLRDSSIGYDEATRSLIIFGGQSQAGLPQQASYILNMDSLTWSIPVTKVASMTTTPPPRSRALGTGDFAANSRREFVIFGGMGSSNEPLNDVWAYDFLNEFWVSVDTTNNGPSPRWGTSGGIDPTDTPNSSNDVSNNFTIVGGSDMVSNFPLSEIWELSLTGTLASDFDTVQGVWRNVSLSSRVLGKSDAGGALVPKTQARPTRIVASGGCRQNSSPLSPNLNCVDSSTVVLTVDPGSSTSINQCPAPRLGPVMVPNLSSASASFASQAFLLLGTFNDSMWNDNGGLNNGEVAVLDVDTGVWARVLPTGDPSSPNMFPEPRVGAAALAFNTALVGPDRASASDIIIFGGQDAATGQYLNDLWILRAYNSTITQSGEKWPGFGDGKVQSGIAATGAGVTINYLTQCAQSLSTTPSTSTSTSSSSGQNPQTTGGKTMAPSREFNTSVAHKILSPASLAIAYVPIVLIRLFLPAVNTGSSSTAHRTSILYVGVIIGIIAYAAGVAGFIIALTTTTSTTFREGSFLRTPHGRGGFILFLLFYAIVPSLFIVPWIRARMNRGLLYSSPQNSSNKLSQDSGAVLGEKLGVNETQRAASPAQSAPETHSIETSPPTKRQRTTSGPGLFPRWSEQSSESVSPPVNKGFEVVNRPRRLSTNNRPKEVVRSLNDLSWLERRRSVGVVADLDYALAHLGQTSPRSASPPPSSRPPTVNMSNRPFVHTPIMASIPEPPQPSVEPSPDETPMDDRPEVQLFRNSGNSPYVYHQPLWRRAVSPDDDHLTRTSHGRPTVETDVDDDDDEDEASRQRRMEEELERRDVHIVTVPRKRLWIANPS
ncbi:hypothetical protein Clacol_001533 [Clathrus columnatus]|uniref:Uncharacterized protein n=1 Tax=Clathrus columnatus TaxID=1419009 RepID=A0AAV5A1M7_9AGAM|nr:hypothetical protein Clacol_001533 [Clathrus columnatus]